MMPSNRRRSHIHYVKQYQNESGEYTGTRIVIFIKDKGIKHIVDLDHFHIHKYERPKDKRYTESKWKQVTCDIPHVVKKQMINESVCKKYKMIHTLYESSRRTVKEYIDKSLVEEKIYLSKEQMNKIIEKLKKH